MAPLAAHPPPGRLILSLPAGAAPTPPAPSWAGISQVRLPHPPRPSAPVRCPKPHLAPPGALTGFSWRVIQTPGWGAPGWPQANHSPRQLPGASCRRHLELCDDRGRSLSSPSLSFPFLERRLWPRFSQEPVGCGPESGGGHRPAASVAPQCSPRPPRCLSRGEKRFRGPTPGRPSRPADRWDRASCVPPGATGRAPAALPAQGQGRQDKADTPSSFSAPSGHK